MKTVSFHNHSTWSDGGASLETMIRAARDKGFTTYGLSDHWVECPDGTPQDWSMPLDALDAYVEEALRLKKAYSHDGFQVLVGLEVDYFEENADAVLAKLKRYPMDYLIGAIHFAGTFSVDHTAALWEGLGSTARRDEVFHAYWAKMLKLCQFGKYDIVAHLDLPKIFGYSPSYDATAEIDAVLQALAASGMKMELNTAGWDKPCHEGYPGAAILTRARQLGIPMLLSSDSHRPEHIGRHYDEGYALLQRIMA